MVGAQRTAVTEVEVLAVSVSVASVVEAASYEVKGSSYFPFDETCHRGGWVGGGCEHMVASALWW